MRLRLIAALAATLPFLTCAPEALAYGPSAPAVPYVQTLPFMAGGAFSQNMADPSVQTDPSSAALVGTLVNLVRTQGAFVNDGLAGGDPICVTNSSVPTVPMVGRYLQTPQTQYMQRGMPIPPGCLPDNAKDATLTVYNPTTHQLWTTWRTSTPAQNAPGCTAALPWGDHCYGDGRWHFYGGGFINDITKSPGYFDYGSVPGFSTTNWGTSATSTVNAARTILVSEVMKGVIPHAVAVASSAALNCQFYDRWPAQRNDGNNTAAPPTCIPEGTFFRIPATVNLQALGLPKFTLMVAQAAQRYGLCMCESTGGGPSLQIEDSTKYGFDAWDAPTLLFGQYRYSAMRAFPWALLQAIAAPTRFHTVAQVASTTSAAPSAGSARSPVSVGVAVASADGRAVPGAVYLSDAVGTQVAGAMLTGTASPGRAVLTFTPSSPGTFTYTVSYGGDQTVKPSATSVTVTVGPPTTRAAIATITSTHRRARHTRRRHHHHHAKHRRRTTSHRRVPARHPARRRRAAP